MYFDLERLNSREASAILQLIHILKCPNPLASCNECDCAKFCSFIDVTEEKCQEICKSAEGV